MTGSSSKPAIDLFGPVETPKPRRSMGGHHSTENETDVWITPLHVIAGLGGATAFDLDPCANDVQPWPTARRGYTEADNGLTSPWSGRVFVNPPYSNPLLPKFLGRLVEHGRGTALIFARTETQNFFNFVWRAPTATAILFLEGRLTFCRPDGTPGDTNAGAPSVLVAYGEEDAAILKRSPLPGFYRRLDTDR